MTRRRRARSRDRWQSDYATSTWIWLGQLFARTAPCFWQGRNRWLGGAAFPDSFSVGTSMMSIALPTGTSREPPSLCGRIRRWFGGGNGEDEAAPAIDPELAHASELCTLLALPGWEASLPKEGGGNLTSGGVAHARLEELTGILREAQETGEVPYENGDEWIELVVAAAEIAMESGGHLLEGDAAIYGAYRWPALDEV